MIAAFAVNYLACKFHSIRQQQNFGHVVQLVEQRLHTATVAGSSPAVTTKFAPRRRSAQALGAEHFMLSWLSW